MGFESEINAEILKFSNDLFVWQRDALRRLLKKGELSQGDKEEVFERARVDHKVEIPVSAPADLTLQENELPATAAGPRIYLVGLSGVVNVNAIESGFRLAFGKGLTVVFGENAVGKSGYARVMKKACIARLVDSILPNVYATKLPSAPASSVFEIEENTAVKKLIWQDGKPSPPPLRRFAVFDSKCGRAYISETNKLTFLPWVFDVLDKLASLTKEIKDRFAAEARKAEPKPNALDPLIDDTSVGKLLGSITADTNIESIQSKAKWDASDEETLEVKEPQLFKLKAGSPSAIRQSLLAERKRIEAAQARLTSIEAVISESKLNELQVKVSDYSKYDQAVKAAAALSFGDVQVKGVGGEAWGELVLAAAKFSTQEAYPGQPFPATEGGVRCVLCLQPLSGDAQARLARFWAFLHDETSTKRGAAKQALDEHVKAIDGLVGSIPQERRTIEESIGASQPDLWEDTKAFLGSAELRAQAIRQAFASSKWENVPKVPVSVVTKCITRIGALDGEMSKVKDDAEGAKQLQALSVEVGELKARKRLSKNIATVIAHLEAVKAAKKLSAAANTISTLAITNKTKDLQEKYVTKAFRESFQAEVKLLGIRRTKVGIAEHSERGKVLHEVTLDGTVTQAEPESVLSEGERTAISVGYFLADLGSTEETCGIILDDPLTSLDHRIRECVINRLVDEAKKRQVVVFTHDLGVYSEIEKAAAVAGVDFQGQHIEALGNHVGIVSDEAPWDVQDVGTRVEKLEKLLKAAVDAEQQGDKSKYESTVAAFYGRLRSTWERSVEELVFNKVVERYVPTVKTQSLAGVAVDEDTITSVYKGMSKTSRTITAHDHAVAAHAPLPGSEVLTEDLRAFKEFMQKQKAKRKDCQEKYGHLKA
jgi:ABC-type dipeptide/oligopeptide/nickel transport system ATPase subunit